MSAHAQKIRLARSRLASKGLGTGLIAGIPVPAIYMYMHVVHVCYCINHVSRKFHIKSTPPFIPDNNAFRHCFKMFILHPTNI